MRGKIVATIFILALLAFSGVTLILTSINIFMTQLKPRINADSMHMLEFMYTSMLGFMLLMLSLQILIIEYILYVNDRVALLKNISEDERKVIDIIRESGGEITQSELVNRTGFSPSKVSRIVKSLERSGLIVRKRSGRIKVVTLKSRKPTYKILELPLRIEI